MKIRNKNRLIYIQKPSKEGFVFIYNKDRDKMSIVLAYSKGNLNVIFSDGKVIGINPSENFSKVRKTGKNDNILFGITGYYYYGANYEKCIFDLISEKLKNYEYNDVDNFKGKINKIVNEELKQYSNYVEGYCFYILFILPENKIVKFYVENDDNELKYNFEDIKNNFESIGNVDLHNEFESNIKLNVNYECIKLYNLFQNTIKYFICYKGANDVNEVVFSESL